MGLLSEKNKEVLLGPLSVNNPVIVQMLGICSAGCNIKTGAGYCNGYFSNGCCGFCQRDHFTAA